MRQLQPVVFALLLGSGCCNLPNWSRDRPAVQVARHTTATPGQVIVLDVALIHRPRGDTFLAHELWDLGNEQGVDLESKPMLQENGLRVGQIAGLLPARLQALLTSPRSCPDPRRLRADPDHPTPVQIGSAQPQLAFQVRQRGVPRAVELSDAQCYLEVVPTIESDRRLRLRFTPRIRHGKAQMQPRVERDSDGALSWAVKASEPVEEFIALSWELTVGHGEYVLIGSRDVSGDTLGEAYFASDKANVQKLLVLRASLLAEQAVDEHISRSPPLALQATWTARGTQQ